MSWTPFICHIETPVDLRSTTDIFGGACEPTPFIDVNRTAQKVRQVYEGHHATDTSVIYDIPDNQYGQIDFSSVVLDEINEKYSLPLVENSQRPVEMFAMEFAGEYNFNIQIYTAFGSPFNPTDTNLQVRIQINDDTAIVLSQIQESSGLDAWTKHYYNVTHSLNKGDLVRLYFYNNNAAGASYQFFILANVFQDSRMIVTADTGYPSSESQEFFLHDAFAGVLRRITGKNCFYSEFFGSTNTGMRQYDADGCAWNFSITKGLQIRGYTLDQKPVAVSFMELWEGASPIFGLGLGYEDIEGIEGRVIRIEPRRHFYQT